MSTAEKAQIIADRELRQYLAGERDRLECSMDRERDFIAEIGRVIAELGK